ncbi:outer membrane beta-barrel protein [Flaviaesturariibacter terrae]
MKHIIRTACLLAAAFLCAPKAEAQIKPFSFGVYAEAGFPTGDMTKIAEAGYGAGISGEVKLPVSLSATGSFGFMHFGGKSLGSNLSTPAVNAFPLRIGAKYRFNVVYVGLETGAAFLSDKNGGGSTGIIAPAIGVRFLNIDIRGKYESWFKSGSLQFWGLQASLKF